jgi:hypothetical protein
LICVIWALIHLDGPLPPGPGADGHLVSGQGQLVPATKAGSSGYAVKRTQPFDESLNHGRRNLATSRRQPQFILSFNLV